MFTIFATSKPFRLVLIASQAEVFSNFTNKIVIIIFVFYYYWLIFNVFLMFQSQILEDPESWRQSWPPSGRPSTRSYTATPTACPRTSIGGHSEGAVVFFDFLGLQGPLQRAGRDHHQPRHRRGLHLDDRQQDPTQLQLRRVQERLHPVLVRYCCYIHLASRQSYL